MDSKFIVKIHENLNSCNKRYLTLIWEGQGSTSTGIDIQLKNWMSRLPSISIRVGDCTITPTRSVRNLGVYFDSRMNMEEFIIKRCRACQLQLHKIARIRKYLSNDTCSCII